MTDPTPKPKPKLTYSLSTTPDPLLAGTQATLEITVSNPSGHHKVHCKEIDLSFVVGKKNAKDFCADTTGIVSSVTADGTPALKWGIEQSGGVFAATPATAKDGEFRGQSLTIRLSGIPVNDLPGTSQLTITETLKDGTTGSETKPLPKFPEGFKLGKFWADPGPVEYGGSKVVRWNGSSHASYQLQYLADPKSREPVTIDKTKGESPRPLPAKGSYGVGPLHVSPYTVVRLVVTAKGVVGSEAPQLERDVEVTVRPKPVPKPAIKRFEMTFAHPPSKVPGMARVMLDWEVDEETADEVVIRVEPVLSDKERDVDHSHNLMVIGQKLDTRLKRTVYFDQKHRVTLTASGKGGKSTRSLEFSAPRFVDFGDGTVQDIHTALVWLKDAACAGPMHWQDAMAWAAALKDGKCGLSDGSKAGDWRLPTAEQWEAMVKAGCYPAISDDAGTGCYSGSSSFVGVQSGYYWSADEFGYDEDADGARAVYLQTGLVFNDYKLNDYSVWPVRSGQ